MNSDVQVMAAAANHHHSYEGFDEGSRHEVLAGYCYQRVPQ